MEIRSVLPGGCEMFLLFFILWIILNGKITVEIVIFGVLICAGVSFFAVQTIGYSLKTERFVLLNFPLLLWYILNLIYEIIKAALTVMTLIFQAEEPDPVLVEFHSGLNSKVQNVLLANSITLTPGTITVFQEEDHFVVHCLRREYAEGIENASFVKRRARLKV